MASSSRVDREGFLANVRRSGLISTEQLVESAARLPITNRGKPLARALVDLGLLTRFQAAQLLVGRTSGFFLGQYCILDYLGQGGMGRVFKAEHRTLSRLVALKVLAPRLLKTARRRNCSCARSGPRPACCIPTSSRRSTPTRRALARTWSWNT